jgi:DNA repair protein RadA/Sms
MAKSNVQYCCSECGAQFSKWMGQCGDCGAWNSLTEVVALNAAASRNKHVSGFAGEAGAMDIQRLADIKPEDVRRTETGLTELDRVLGGGLVTGAVTLIGGDPGIGKSTLLLQTLVSLSSRLRTLYVTGEESLQQVSLRAHRLSLEADDCHMLSETRVESIISHAGKYRPQVIVIDSIQTMYTDLLQSAPGAVAQVRESAAQLVRFAKQTGTSLFIVGHVTKEGTLAGPRVLEHMVDTVLYFEGDSGSPFRVIRAIKNRFGAVNELGAFAMTETGLKQVTNPSAIFLSRHEQPVSGSVIMVTREGSRPLLVELQALVAESHLANPRRVTVGLDQNRLAMLLAVLHRHGGIAMYDQDVFVNIVGGIRVSETAADLPLLMAALSSFRDRPLAHDTVMFGEVGLAGEIRPVQNGQDRLREAAKHGFRRAIVPRANAPKQSEHDLEIITVSRLGEAIEYL